MVRFFWSIGVAVAVAAVPNVGVGQRSPRETADRFLEAVADRRWSEAARLLDLDGFDRFREDFIARARRQSGGPEITVEEILRRNPGMPREVAEYQVREMDEQRRRYADPTPFEFARVRSLAALRGLTTEEAAARWLESRDPRYSAELQYEQAGCRVPDDLDQIPAPRRRVIGTVAESGATYVLVKEEQPGGGAPDYYGGDLVVMVLKERGGRWYVEPRGDLLPEVDVGVDPSTCGDESRRDR